MEMRSGMCVTHIMCTRWHIWCVTHTSWHTATHCNTLLHTATQSVLGCCSNCSDELPCIVLRRSEWHTATHCYTLQHTATHCYTLQHTATQRVVCEICTHISCVIAYCEWHIIPPDPINHVCFLTGKQISKMYFTNCPVQIYKIIFRRFLFSRIWSSAQDYALLDLLLNPVVFWISTWQNLSGENDLYWRCTSFEKAFRRGRPLNILHDS